MDTITRLGSVTIIETEEQKKANDALIQRIRDSNKKEG